MPGIGIVIGGGFSSTGGSLFEAMVADGARSIWRLDETTGTVAADSADAKNGTYGGTSYTLGQAGLDASDPTNDSVTFANPISYVTIGNEYSFERTDPFTAEALFKTSSATTQLIIGKVGVAPDSTGWSVFLQANGAITVALTDIAGATNNLRVDTIATGFNNGSARHLMVTYDGSSSPSGINIYVDGVIRPHSTVYNSLTGSIMNTDALFIGRRASQSDLQFLGSIDEVALYLSELSAGQAYAHAAFALGL